MINCIKERQLKLFCGRHGVTIHTSIRRIANKNSMWDYYFQLQVALNGSKLNTHVCLQQSKFYHKDL